METQRIAIVSFHKFAGGDWPVEEFTSREVKLVSSETVWMPLAERSKMEERPTPKSARPASHSPSAAVRSVATVRNSPLTR